MNVSCYINALQYKAAGHSQSYIVLNGHVPNTMSALCEVKKNWVLMQSCTDLSQISKYLQSTVKDGEINMVLADV